MRRLALLLAGGALWLVYMAIPVFADGGPHVVVNNSGTGTIGLAGDCAGCHRAHRGQAADLLKDTMPALCLSCHDGTGATTNVVDGFQYVPTGSNPAAGEHDGDVVLGPLRGGGFQFALIGGPSRITYNARNGIDLTWSAAPTSCSVQLNWPAFGSGPKAFAGGSVTINFAYVEGTAQGATDTLFGTSTTYTTATNAAYMSGTTTSLMDVSWSGTSVRLRFAPHNEFKEFTIPVPAVDASSTCATPTVVENNAKGSIGHVSALADGAETTSNHMGGQGYVWGNGPQGDGGPGAEGVTLVCTNCHNPHGNGQYRILNTHPGEDWDGDVDVTDWVPPVNAVAIADVGVTTTTKNYTINPASSGGLATYQAGDVVGSSTAGDYWRYRYDPSGFSNFTNFYLRADPMHSGWVGAGATAYSSLTNETGAMTAWCIQCHTRYNGYFVNADGTPTGTSSGSAPSYAMQTPEDATFKYKHGTVRLGCEQCHVSHGTNVAMSGPAADLTYPDGTPSGTDSFLLKVANRGTCQMCHDPTGTVTAGTTVNTVPSGPTPGP